jgi:hypothetical protein
MSAYSFEENDNEVKKIVSLTGLETPRSRVQHDRDKLGFDNPKETLRLWDFRFAPPPPPHTGGEVIRKENLSPKVYEAQNMPAD